jgi:glycine betaine/proline transport system ATP-binding protein
LVRWRGGYRIASLIEVHQLTKIFGNRLGKALELLRNGLDREEIRRQTGCTVALNKVSFEIEQGELFVIMGLSGSGKSTLLRCLNRLIDPTDGEVWIDNCNLSTLKKSDLLRFRQKRVAMVFQKSCLFPNRTVLQNVAYGLEIRNIPKPDRLRIAREKLELVGLAGWEDQYPQNLSGGMQQRVGLARALATDADILLMDEPFSALDPLTRTEMQTELLNLQTKLHKTIVFITHDVNEAFRLGDRIALMKEGEVVQVGTANELIHSPANHYVANFVRDIDRGKIFLAQHAMRKPKVLFTIGQSTEEALQELLARKLFCAVVLNSLGHVQGITTIDYLERAIRLHGDTEIVQEILEPVTKVRPDTPLSSVLPLVIQSEQPVAVVDEQNRLLGIIDQISMLETLASRGGGDINAEDTVGSVDQ